MKKLLILFGAFATFTFTSCSSDDDNNSNEKSCEELADEVSDAADEFGNDDSSENCLAYKQALEAYIEQCADEDDGGFEYEEILENLPCNN